MHSTKVETVMYNFNILNAAYLSPARTGLRGYDRNGVHAGFNARKTGT